MHEAPKELKIDYKCTSGVIGFKYKLVDIFPLLGNWDLSLIAFVGLQ